jgi:hypothetical protein
VQASPGPADVTEAIPHPLTAAVQACAGGATATGAAIAKVVDMAVTSAAASFFI